jgi:hypothetical protein
VPTGPADQPGRLGEPVELPVPVEPADLPVPVEPVELRARTRALAEQAPEQARALLDAGSWIADPLWRHWGPALAAAGMDRQDFGAVVAGYRRELWLWVMGERTWAQSADGLRGRVRRRVAAPGRRAAAAR